MGFAEPLAQPLDFFISYAGGGAGEFVGQADDVLLCTKPHKEWMLGQLTGPGKPVKIFKGTRFKSLAEGEWEIFRRRWRRYAGSKID